MVSSVQSTFLYASLQGAATWWHDWRPIIHQF